MDMIILLIITYKLVKRCVCVNWALGKHAEQSTTWNTSSAHLAVDGNNSSDFFDLSCSHTLTTNFYPWWKVDIGKVITVTAVGIINRGDCCGERLHNVMVTTHKIPNYLLGPSCGFQPKFSAGELTFIKCKKPVRARFVVITKYQPVLTLCEVFVEGNDKPIDNWALKKPVKQSSTDGKPASVTVDGITDESCTRTLVNDSSPQWNVNLENEVTVTAVGILHHGEELRDIYIEVRRQNNSIGLCIYREDPIPAGELLVMKCQQEQTGIQVYIRKTGVVNSRDVLTLCEVIVQGYDTPDGAWGTWTVDEKGECNVECGFGWQLARYSRKCDNPKPKPKGENCQGINKKTGRERCEKAKTCPVNGMWGSWSYVRTGYCSTKCGVGTRELFYSRKCDNPEPQNGGKPCVGSDSTTMSRKCVDRSECPVAGGWNVWVFTEKGQCDTKCGTGRLTMFFSRQCDNPKPKFGGKQCVGDVSRTSSAVCKDRSECPVNGQWGSWSLNVSGPCSVICAGIGHRFRYYERFCNKPAPRFEGEFCPGNSSTALSEECFSLKICPSRKVTLGSFMRLVIGVVIISVLCGTTIYCCVYRWRPRYMKDMYIRVQSQVKKLYRPGKRKYFVRSVRAEPKLTTAEVTPPTTSAENDGYDDTETTTSSCEPKEGIHIEKAPTSPERQSTDEEYHETFLYQL